MTQHLEWRPIEELPNKWPSGAMSIDIIDISFGSRVTVGEVFFDMATTLRDRLRAERVLDTGLFYKFTYPPQTEERQ